MHICIGICRGLEECSFESQDLTRTTKRGVLHESFTAIHRVSLIETRLASANQHNREFPFNLGSIRTYLQLARTARRRGSLPPLTNWELPPPTGKSRQTQRLFPSPLPLPVLNVLPERLHRSSRFGSSTSKWINSFPPRKYCCSSTQNCLSVTTPGSPSIPRREVSPMQENGTPK